MITYSINSRLGGHGIGQIAYQAALGIYRSQLLACLLVSSNAQVEIPKSLIREWGLAGRVVKYAASRSKWPLINSVEGAAFDAWVSFQLPEAAVFHGWNGSCLRSLRKAKTLDMTTVIDGSSSHPDTWLELLGEEYRQWGVPFNVSQKHLRLRLREFEVVEHLTIPSSFVRESMINAGVPEKKLIDLPFGVDLVLFSRSQKLKPRPFRVLFAGQVSLRKGVPYLLDSWRRLGWRDAELWLVGSVLPDFRDLLGRWTGLRGLKLLPHTRDMPNVYRQADIFAFPTIEEGSALVTYEALACGLPVITTPNAGSVVRDGVEGYIIPIRDVEALCTRLQQLRDDHELRQQMEHRARSRAEEFPWSRYQRDLVKGYREIAGR